MFGYLQSEERQRVQCARGTSPIPWGERAGVVISFLLEISPFVSSLFLFSSSENHWHLCIPPCRTLHTACTHTQVHKHHHIHNHIHIHLPLQAYPDAGALWSVDVHGGEHLARDAVHRPPCPHVHANQVIFKLISF